MKKWLPYIILLVAFIFFFTGDVEAQCSQCKLLAEQSGNSIDDKILDNNNGNNMNSAILYIMASPYILLARSEEHTSELHSRPHLVCRLLLEKKKNKLHTSVHSIKSVPLRPRFRPLATAILPQDPRGGRPHDRAHTCPDVLSLRGVFDARAPL